MDQHTVSHQNRLAWNSKPYQAWVKKFGTPVQAADALKQDPAHRSRRISPYLTQIHGKKIANPLGSNGRLGISLALQGAEVTVLDIAEENQRYALNVAHHAGVKIDFIVTDFAQGVATEQWGSFDVVILELGVLHYFLDLGKLFQTIRQMLKPDGLFILNEFHPLLKKSIAIEDGAPVFTGNYFDDAVEHADVAYRDILSGERLPECYVRRWTLGEIVTAVARQGFVITALDELTGWQTTELPELFTLTATCT